MTDQEMALLYLGAVAIVLCVLVIRLARAYEALYMEWSLAEIENSALFAELQRKEDTDGRSCTA